MSLDGSKLDSQKPEENEQNVFFQLAQIVQKFSKELNSIVFPVIEWVWESCKSIWNNLEKVCINVSCIFNPYPTYSQYCQLVKEFHSGNENSKLYNQLIRPHFTAISFEWEIQKAHANYFELLKEFLNDTDTGKSVSKDLKDILLHLWNIPSLRESIWKKSHQARYDILNEYLKILPYIYNSARVNILWNVVVFLLWKSSFSISWKTWLYWKEFLQKL